MKKIMIAAAIVCAAAMTQAATVSWTCSNVKQGDAGVSGIAYFVDAAVLSQENLLALAGTGASAFTAALGSGYTADTKQVGAYSYSGSSGTFTVRAENAVANATLGLKDGADYTAYLVVFDSAEITDASKFYITETKSVSTYEGATDNQNVKWGSQSSASVADGAWHSVGAVPEPTSGLLMLLGVAGLALKRKRA